MGVITLEKSTKYIVVGMGVVIVVLLFLMIGGGRITGNVVKNVGCKTVTEYRTETYTEKVPYEDVEYYTETVNANNCDGVSGCTCLHKSWFGLGACDSCECRRTRTVTKYRDETRTRQVPYSVEKCAWD